MLKKLKQILIKFPWPEVVLLTVILVVGLPSLFVSWMIVDDGYYFSVEQKISQAISSLNFPALGDALSEPDRFRPGLRFYLWLTYLVAGNNPVIHHLINFLISALTVLLIYSIIKILTSSRSAGLFAGLIFTLTSFNLENWYRLMTPEPKITFFVALSLFFLTVCLKRFRQSGKLEKPILVLAVFPLFFVYLIRETSFSFLPFSLFLFTGAFYFKKNTKQRLVWLKTIGIFFIFNLLLATISLLTNLILKKQGSYTGFYEVSPSKMFSIGLYYLRLIRQTLSPFVSLLGISFLISWLLMIRSKRISFERFWQMIFLIAFISSFVALLPWGIPLGRYLELSLFFLSLVLGLEFNALLNYRFVSKKWYFWTFLICFVLMLSVNLAPMYNYIRDTIVGQKNINKVLLYLADQAPKDDLILWNLKENEGTIELVMEANLILNHLYNRPDLKIEYLNDTNLKTLPSQAMVMSAIVYEKDQYYKERELLTRKHLELIKTIPHQIQTVSLNLPRLRSLVRSMITGEPFLARPILEKSSFKTEWKIYQVI